MLAGCERACAVWADAADAASLGQAFAGADMVVVASSTACYAENVARAALAAGADVIDIQYSKEKTAVLRRLAAEIEQAGRCFITDGGYHPGLPAALVRYAAMRIERLAEAIVGSVINVDWASFDLKAETKEEFTREFMEFEGRVFHDSQWETVSGFAAMKSKTMSFGPPFGARTCVAMPLSEMDSLPELIPTLRETGFYIAGFNTITDWIVSPLVVAGLKISPERLIGPMSRLLFWSMSRFTRPPFGTTLRLDAAGTTGGLPHQLTVQLSHEDGYEFTAIPVVASLLQWQDGATRRPGLVHQAHFVHPERLLRDMVRMGVAIDIVDNLLDKREAIQIASQESR
jgi:saccharopine dehydrogenase (NAD+, L-lysine-forming)